MKEIRIGIIGTGIIAHTHAQQYAKIPGVTIAAACDLKNEKLAAFCMRYGIKDQYTDYRELIARDDLDAVDVCLHNNLHAPISVDVMRAGKHCYCEKPMAGSYVDALAMKAAAEKLGKKLHIQLSMIYGGGPYAAKKLIDEGYLGKLYHARSYGYRRRGRPFVDGYGEKEFDSTRWAGHGALYDMGVYHISQLLYVMGMPKLERVSGRVYQELPMDPVRKAEGGFDVEELGLGLASFEGGLSMDILESWAIQGGEFPMSSVHGNKGGIQFVPEVASGGSVIESLKFYSQIAGYPASTVLDVSAEEYRRHQSEPGRWMLDGSVAHWVGVLRGDVEPIDTAAIALATMQVSEGIFLSDKLGREVTADEIENLSQSIALAGQEAPFGKLAYPPHPFL